MKKMGKMKLFWTEDFYFIFNSEFALVGFLRETSSPPECWPKLPTRVFVEEKGNEKKENVY